MVEAIRDQWAIAIAAIAGVGITVWLIIDGLIRRAVHRGR
jgi:hypothetical protein